MFLRRAALVAILAVILATGHAEQLVHKKGPGENAPRAGPGGPPGPPPTPHHGRPMERQSRGFDFLAPLRGIFGGGRPRSPPAAAAASPAMVKQPYGIKPAASEQSAKPAPSPPYPSAGPGPEYPQDGFRPGFAQSFADFGPYNNDEYGGQGLQGSPSSHGPQGAPHPGSPPPHPPHYGKTQYGKRPPPPPRAGPHGHPAHGHGPHGHGPHGHGPSGPPPQFGGGPRPTLQADQQFTYHTYSKPVIKQHHYHTYMKDGQPMPMPEGPAGPGPAYDGPQSAQQHQVPSFAHPGSNGPQFGNSEGGFGSGPGSAAPTGFQDFGGFGPANLQAQGSQSNPADFFGAGQDVYAEQYEDQTRNTREPQIITADPGYGGPQGPAYPEAGGFGGDYFPPSSPTEETLNSPTSSPRPFFPESSTTPAAYSAQGSGGPIIKSHPLRSPGRGRPVDQSPHQGQYDEESRRQPFLYRPVSGSIQVPGAVDEDAVYGKPMMMDATTPVTRRPVRLGKKPMKPHHHHHHRHQEPQSSNKQPVYAPFPSAPPPPPSGPGPFKRPAEIMPLESPRDPHYKPASSQQHVTVLDSDAAATGHHHHGGHHGLESANGDRILYHVAGHEGPYSYRFGYDTGKGHNRMFRFEEKDGKGYVTGKYGFYDKHGKLNVVKYEAHPEHGYHAERQHGHHHQTHHVGH